MEGHEGGRYIEDSSDEGSSTVTTENVLFSVEVNDSAKTPTEYFNILKTSLTDSDEAKLKAQLNTIATQLIKAEQLGQTSYLNRLSFAYNTVIKEQLLLVSGFTKYVLKEDIQRFLRTVTPKNSIKIIELERFPRAIPNDNLDDIIRAKNLNIFDGFAVVFTDFTDEIVQTPAEKEYVQKNRDPIVFGYFKTKDNELNYDRYYFITDWEDEYCDLTFTKMIDKMSNLGIKNAEGKISTDTNYLLRASAIAESTIQRLEKEASERNNRGAALWRPETIEVKKPSGLIEKVRRFIVKYGQLGG